MGQTKILIIDDEKEIRQAVAAFMQDEVDIVDQAENGLIALDMILKNKYDCVVSDIRMPKMTGLDLLKKVREHKIFVPFILFTAFDEKNYMLESLKYGAFGFIQKPDYLELKKLLRKIFAKDAEQELSAYKEMLNKKIP